MASSSTETRRQPQVARQSTSRSPSPPKKSATSPNLSRTTSRTASKPLPINRKDTTETADATPMSPTKRGMERVRTFLHRKNSSTSEHAAFNNGSQSNSRESTVSNPTFGTINTFSFASNRSSVTSPSATPPSPGGSPTSTLNEAESESLPDENELSKRHTLADSCADAGNPAVQTSITWGPGVPAGRPVNTPRRRSVSTDHVPIIKKAKEMIGIAEEDEPKLKLHHAFSRDAREGTGLKARRLSTCLPDEFLVDYCELDKEFKSSTLLPGRRGKLLGKGATSVVRLMVHKGDSSGKFFAVKEFRGKERDENEDDYQKKVKSEYTIAKSIHHPNIVETVRLCTHSHKWNHVMEYCQFGELYSLVERGYFKNGTFKQADKMCFFKQLVRGVDYLHEHGIAHRDIKLENLLLTTDGFLKITDFGVSEVFSGEHPGLRSAQGECGKNMGEVRRCQPGICGSLPYIAPEVLAKKGDYDPRPLDVWSCAIVYLTMTFGGSPWAAAKEDGNPYYAKFMAGWDAWLEKNPEGKIHDGTGGAPNCGPMFSPQYLGSPALKRLVLKMLHPIPEKRISIHDVLVGSTLRGIECCSQESYDDNCCAIDASKCGKKAITKRVKHSHIPPREHKTPKLLQHRFDMGDGWN